MSPSPVRQPVSVKAVSLTSHVAFLLGSVALLLALFAGARAALLLDNQVLMGAVPTLSVVKAFANGARFDLQVIALMCAPLLLALLSVHVIRARSLMVAWLTLASSLYLSLAAAELVFFNAFEQRFSGQLFEYLRQDPHSLASQFYAHFSVQQVLLLWCGATLVLALLFYLLERLTRARGLARPVSVLGRLAVFCLFLLLGALAVRGTVRLSGPLNWGDAYNTEARFTNQLGLNSLLSLLETAQFALDPQRAERWQATLTNEQALEITRSLLLSPHDQLLDADQAALRRLYSAPASTQLAQVRNVVVIILAGFGAAEVGALGGDKALTPNFDALAEQGLLFERIFANGADAQQALLASMSCFASVPSYEALMRMPEGRQAFSGLANLLSARGYQSVYVHNGSLSQHNQGGFLRNQGVQQTLGAEAYPHALWLEASVQQSDQQMFHIAEQALNRLSEQQPFYAVLQTSAAGVPENLPVAAVQGYGEQDAALTALRYSDWALGEFFTAVRTQAYFAHTLFVLIGDQGLPSAGNNGELDLARYHVPMLLLGPGVQQAFGKRSAVVGSQVDLVPTVMGRLAQPVQHQCWGRDLLTLAQDDAGFALMNLADKSLALVSANQVLHKAPEQAAALYQYELGAKTLLKALDDELIVRTMQRQLGAYVQSASNSLQNNSAGAVSPTADELNNTGQ